MTDAALEPFQADMPAEEIAPLDYLRTARRSMLQIQLEIGLIPRGEEREYRLSKTSSKELYWSFQQMIAHHSSNGTRLGIGDLLASGTISGESKQELGCLLEASLNGREPVQIREGLQCSFLDDGDTIIMRGYCEKDGIRVGFGKVRGTILG